MERIRAAVADEPDAGRRLELGLEDFLESCLDPETQRIVMLDGPAVLGPEDLHAVDERHGLAMIEETLADAMESGDLERDPVEPLSHILLGALNAAAIAIARARTRWPRASRSARRSSASSAACDRAVFRFGVDPSRRSRRFGRMPSRFQRDSGFAGQTSQTTTPIAESRRPAASPGFSP